MPDKKDRLGVIRIHGGYVVWDKVAQRAILGPYPTRKLAQVACDEYLAAGA